MGGREAGGRTWLEGSCAQAPPASRLSWGEIWGKQYLCFCKNSQ